MRANAGTAMGELEQIALTRLRLVVAPDGPTRPDVAAATLAELAHVGVAVSNPERLTDAFAAHVPALAAAVRSLRGERGTFSPLFRGFPDRLPRWDDGQVRFTLACCRLFAALTAEGSAIDLVPGPRPTGLGVGRSRSGLRLRFTEDHLREALDFTEIGWWPPSSIHQDPDRTRIDRALQRLLPGDVSVQWMHVTLVRPDEMETRLRAWMASAFAVPSSLREDVRAQLGTLCDCFGVEDVDPASVTFRETRTLLLSRLWNTAPYRLRDAGVTPDDLLRIFADLTGTDASLTSEVSFPRLSRAQRRLVVELLEDSPRLADVFRRRGLWLAIARGLHLREFEAPRVAETFARLRAGKHDRTSLMSRTERAVTAGDPGGAASLLAAEAPSVLARRLRQLAAAADRAGQQPAFLRTVAAAAERIPLRVLYAALAQVRDNGITFPRLALSKSGGALPIRRPPGHLALPPAFRDELAHVLEATISARQSAKGPMAGERVYVDPALRRVLMPDQLRSTAAGLVQAERGTRLPLGDAAVLRMFVHWRQPEDHVSDLDLSLQVLDDDFAPLAQVSWTNLAAGAMTHSGDLTSAPVGAQEFIDVRLADADVRPGWRYLMPTVYRYSGPAFGRLTEAHVGWMLRDECSSDRATFDPATVVNAFALTGSRGTAAPVLVDLKTREVVYVDLYRRSFAGARVERDGLEVAELVRTVVDRHRTKVSVAEVALTAAACRGAQVVDDRDDADITFGLTHTSTYNALAPETLLAELY